MDEINFWSIRRRKKWRVWWLCYCRWSYFEGQATVTQVNKDGEDGQSYTINNIWPTVLGEIALSWETDG